MGHIYGYHIRHKGWKTWGTLQPGDAFILPDWSYDRDYRPLVVVETFPRRIKFKLPHADLEYGNFKHYRNSNRDIEVVEVLEPMV